MDAQGDSRCKTRKTKVKNELHLEREVKDNKRFYKNFGEKRKIKETMGPLLNSQGTEDAKNAGLLNSYIASVFTKKLSYNQTVNKDYLDKEGDKLRDDITKDTISKFLTGLNEFKSAGTKEFHHKILKELAFGSSVYEGV